MTTPTDYIEKIEMGDNTIYIIPDTDCVYNPRDDFDNLWNFVSNYKHYGLSEGDLSLDELMQPESRKRLEKDYLIVPVYMYIHSGIALSLAPFNDPWDSGVGFIACISKATLRKEYHTKRVTASVRERALNVLKGEVETLGAYLDGDVYGYEIYDKDGDLVDSCYGFYGLEYAKEEAKSAAKVA